MPRLSSFASCAVAAFFLTIICPVSPQAATAPKTDDEPAQNHKEQTAKAPPAAQAPNAGGHGHHKTHNAASAAKMLLKNMDNTTDPCKNFYKYACGGWLKAHPIPGDKSSYSKFLVMSDRVDLQLKELLSLPNTAPALSNSQAVKLTKKFYKMCTNINQLAQAKGTAMLAHIKKKGGWPMLGDWNEQKAKSIAALNTAVKRDMGLDILWNMEVGTDEKEATKNVIFIDQLKVLLGAKDFYLDAKKNEKVIAAYKTYVMAVADLLAKDGGLQAAGDMKAQVEKQWEFEVELAKIDWDKYFAATVSSHVRAAIKDDTKIIVVEPEYMKKLTALVNKTDRKAVTNFMIATFVLQTARALDERYLDVGQIFFKTFIGRDKRAPKWKSCVQWAVQDFNKGLGALYVNRYFTDKDKTEIDTLVKDMSAAMGSMIKGNPWMDEPTRSAAGAKLKEMVANIAYPDMLKDMAKLDQNLKHLTDGHNKVPNEGFLDLFLRLKRFIKWLEFDKLTKPVDRKEFPEGAATVNAFYTPSLNSITFPAGILQPPFFHGNFPKSVNFGAIGAIIGHELTHGFDDQGAQYNGVGNIKDWWSPKSKEDFTKRTKCFVEQYNGYEVAEIKEHVKGDRTQGENIADVGGLKAAFHAYKAFLKSEHGKLEQKLPGLDKTNEQIFFLSFANIWCKNTKPEAAKADIVSDPHAPTEFRVNGVLANFDEFSKAFKCPASKNKCEIW